MNLVRTFLLGLCAAAAACGGASLDPGELGSGAIRSLQNFPGTNAQTLDVAFDPKREGLLLAAMQSGPADYGRGPVGRAANEPPTLVLGRYNVQLQALWSTIGEAAFAASSKPALAVDGEGNMLLALGDFTGELDLGVGPRAAGVVAQLSVADGFARWSVSVDQLPRFVLARADGVTIVAGEASGPPDSGLTQARIDLLAAGTGTLLASRPLAQGTGNVTIESLGMDVDGNLLAGGAFDGTVSLASMYSQVVGQQAAFVAKLGRDSGAALWSRPLRKRASTDRIVVAPLANGDVAMAGTFAFADDANDTDDALGPTIYLRLARLSGATGETVWTSRVNLPNTAMLDVVDLADGTEDLLLNATFSGTFQLGALNAVSTADTSMALARFSGSDGTPQWLRFTSTTTARGYRVGVDASGDAIGVGTFATQSAAGATFASIFVIRVVP